MSFPNSEGPVPPSNMSGINVLSGAQNVVVSGAVNVAETINYNFHLYHAMTSNAAIPLVPNPGTRFTGRADILAQLKDHFAESPQLGEAHPTSSMPYDVPHQSNDRPLEVKIKEEAFILPRSVMSMYLESCTSLAISPPPEMSPFPRRLISLAYGGNGQQLLQYIQAPLNPSGPKKRRMVFPMLNMNPAMPTCPGEPGLLFASRHEILHNSPWSLFCRSMEGKEAKWRYLGEYHSVLCGKMTAEQFRAQKQAVKDRWGKLILESKRHDVYVAMLARMALRKYGLLPSVDDASAKALEIAEMAAIRSKMGRHVTPQDVTDAFSQGDEAIDILRMECISYDHIFAADIATRLRGYNKLLAGAQNASRGKGGRRHQKSNKEAGERSSSVQKIRGDSMIESDLELTDDDCEN